MLLVKLNETIMQFLKFNWYRKRVNSCLNVYKPNPSQRSHCYQVPIVIKSHRMENPNVESTRKDKKDINFLHAVGKASRKFELSTMVSRIGGSEFRTSWGQRCWPLSDSKSSRVSWRQRISQGRGT